MSGHADPHAEGHDDHPDWEEGIAAYMKDVISEGDDPVEVAKIKAMKPMEPQKPPKDYKPRPPPKWYADWGAWAWILFFLSYGYFVYTQPYLAGYWFIPVVIIAHLIIPG